MSDTPDPLSTFADLRRVAIGYAQDASREMWTDYNVHDPGVTLLEQTCFALSQLAYQTEHPTRDLLTTSNGNFAFRSMGLQAPRKVLGTAPVTRADLEQWLNLCPQVERVVLSARGAATPGLYDAVIYSDTEDPEGLCVEIRAAFARVRPLGCALGRVVVARTVKVLLSGTVDVAPGLLPETIAAEIYMALRGYLAGHPNVYELAEAQGKAGVGGATRANVYAAPERLVSEPRAPGVPGANLESAYGLLRDLPGVREIEPLMLRPVIPLLPIPRGPVHLHLVLPNKPSQIDLRLRLDGTTLTLDPGLLREEYIRLDAQRVALSYHHLDAPDWDVLRPGRPRRFDLSHVDGLLPMVYRAQKGGDRARFDTYRGAVNAVLQDMRGALETAPATFSADRTLDVSDPVAHRRRMALLDYLIALQGVEMPATDHTGLHLYRGVVARQRFAIDWRLRMLHALPQLHATRATGPGPQGPGGFLAMLALLCDLDILPPDADAPSLAAYGLHLRKEAPLAERPDSNIVRRIKTVNPLDTLPVEQPDAVPFPVEMLRRYSPFLADGTISLAVFKRLVAPEAIWTTPGAGGAWQVVVDLGAACDSGPWEVARFTPDETADVHPRVAAMEAAARLRATWRHLHRSMEQIRLVEPVLSGAPPGTEAQTVHLVLPGWTARTSLDPYRAYVEAQVAQCAPMYLHVTVHWLSLRDTEVDAALGPDVVLTQREAVS